MKESLESKSALFNQSLEKGLLVLQAFTDKRSTMTLQEVADAASITKSSAQRLIYTLEQLGFIRRSATTRRFQLATRVMRIGCNYLETDQLINVANPFLAGLSSTSGETVALTEPDDLDMVYVARFTSHKSIPIHVPIGRHLPMYCTSAGRAYLSGLSSDESLVILTESDRQSYTEYTSTDLDVLSSLVADARKRGFAYNNQEYYLGEINVAAPILNSWGMPIGSVHISAPSTRWTFNEALEKLGPMVIDAARGISNAARTIDFSDSKSKREIQHRE